MSSNDMFKEVFGFGGVPCTRYMELSYAFWRVGDTVLFEGALQTAHCFCSLCLEYNINSHPLHHLPRILMTRCHHSAPTLEIFSLRSWSTPGSRFWMRGTWPWVWNTKQGFWFRNIQNVSRLRLTWLRFFVPRGCARLGLSLKWSEQRMSDVCTGATSRSRLIYGLIAKYRSTIIFLVSGKNGVRCEECFSGHRHCVWSDCFHTTISRWHLRMWEECTTLWRPFTQNFSNFWEDEVDMHQPPDLSGRNPESSGPDFLLQISTCFSILHAETTNDTSSMWRRRYGEH